MIRFSPPYSARLQVVSLVKLLLFSQATWVGAATIYVNDDAGGANDGSSWTNAYNDLQDALAATGSGDQIWVAAGRYVLGAPSGYYRNGDGARSCFARWCRVQR